MRKVIVKITIVFLLFSSCKSNYDVYISNPKLGGDYIQGYQLHKFYQKTSTIKRANIINRELFAREMLLIKDSLLRSEPLHDKGENFGFYKYAFIISEDTLYSNHTLEGWRYKNHVCKYEKVNKDLKTEILLKDSSVN